jgi:hypothetical protein
MKYVKCNLCGFDDAKLILRARNRITNEEKKFFKLAKCRRCSLVYLNSRPEKEDIKKYYPPWYHSRAHKMDKIGQGLNLLVVSRRKS